MIKNNNDLIKEKIALNKDSIIMIKEKNAKITGEG